jgi:hypothetical protein
MAVLSSASEGRQGLSNIFNKLGIADRVSLARVVERADGMAEARLA